MPIKMYSTVKMCWTVTTCLHSHTQQLQRVRQIILLLHLGGLRTGGKKVCREGKTSPDPLIVLKPVVWVELGSDEVCQFKSLAPFSKCIKSHNKR